MARRSLGELTVNIVAADASFAEGMDRVSRKSERTARKVASDQKQAARESEAAWQAATKNISGGVSDKQYTAAMRGLPAQFTDAVVSLQGGQNPLTVLLQQGGQVKDMFGGILPAVKAVTSAISAMITPASLLAGALAVVGYGWYAGEQETQKFRVALETTGNQVGVTIGQLHDMAASMNNVAGITQSQAAEALTMFATSAGVGADRLQQYTTTALQWEKATGQAADTVVEKFKKVADDPVKGLLGLNKQMGFLTSATFEQVKALQLAGKETEAVRVAQDALDRAMASASQNIVANLGYAERAMNAIGNATRGAISWVKQLGRDVGNATQLADTVDRINDLQSKGVQLVYSPEEAKSYAERDLYNLKQREIQLQKNLVAERNTANAKKTAQDNESTLIELSEEATRYADRRTQRTQALLAAENKYGAAAKQNAEAAKQYAMVIAGIEERFKDPTPARGRTPRAAGKPEAERELERELRAADQFMKTLERRALGAEKLNESERLLNDLRISGVKLSGDQLDKATGLVAKMDMVKELEAQRAAEVAGRNQLSEAENRLLSTQQQLQAQLSVFGLSDREAERQQAKIEMLQKHQAEERELYRDQANALALAESSRIPALEKEYADRIALLKLTQEQELELVKDSNEQKAASEGKWRLGMKAGINNFLEDTKAVYYSAKDAAKNVFSSMSDAMANFVKTGKLDFRSLAESILGEFAKIAANDILSKMLKNGTASGGGGWIQAIAGLFGGFSSGGWTGSAPRDQVTGVVHGQEYVLNAEATQRLGRENLEMMNRGAALPSASTQPQARVQPGNFTYNNAINVQGSMNRDTQNQILIEQRRLLDRSRRLGAA